MARPLAALLLLCICLAGSPGLGLEVPPLTGRVVDLAGLLSPAAEQRIDALAAGLEKTDSTQVAVLTLPSLQGRVLEEYAVKVATAWGLGRKDFDNGVLLLVAKAEREVRIEVGYGLEGRLTDLLAGRIVDRVMLPRFKAGDFDGGVLAGVEAVAQAVRGEYKAPTREQRRDGSGLPVGGILMFLLMAAQFALYNRWLGGLLGAAVTTLFGLELVSARLLFVPLYAAAGFGLGFGLASVAAALRPPRPAGRTATPSRSRRQPGWMGWPGGFGQRGGFGGGGFGGGGFSGGGGGFGGGGASGKW